MKRTEVDGIHSTDGGVGDAINSQRETQTSCVSIANLTIAVALKLTSVTIMLERNR